MRISAHVCRLQQLKHARNARGAHRHARLAPAAFRALQRVAALAAPVQAISVGLALVEVLGRLGHAAAPAQLHLWGAASITKPQTWRAR